ncbi:hypothetical protein BKA62DRAFT_667791 [Auriculariales sp. MPI-PUGE-AT-0066]|nr:hypothetical protein BKA62DRAFT_667791 [Auriculariales sp. MPI-PUGE-AT-0066]
MSTEGDGPPPPASAGQFILKTAPVPGSAPSRFTGLFLRQHSVVNPAVLLNTGPPKFLRGNFVHEETASGVKFTSWAPRHAGRFWGVVLSAGWERVEIAEGQADDRLRIIDSGMLGVELLDGAGIEEWTGWMVCEWSLGHPQLFWTTKSLQGELPGFCERVTIVKEMLSTST